jgi:hypothetical protein
MSTKIYARRLAPSLARRRAAAPTPIAAPPSAARRVIELLSGMLFARIRWRQPKAIADCGITITTTQRGHRGF